MHELDELSLSTPWGQGSVKIFENMWKDASLLDQNDCLVLSAYPDDDSPTDGTMESLLKDWGLSLPELAQHKALDLRAVFGCWMSQELEATGSLPFKRILCVESFWQSLPSDLVHDIFRFLSLFYGRSSPLKLLMPIPSSKNSGSAAVLAAIAGAAAYWMGRGLPVECLKLFIDKNNVDEQQLKAALRKGLLRTQLLLDPKDVNHYDLFISYCGVDQREAIVIYNEIKRLDPNLKLFLGQRGRLLGPGEQSKTFDALDHSRVFLSLLSEEYFHSPLCLRELYIADAEKRLQKIPLWLGEGKIPSWMPIPPHLDFRGQSLSVLKKSCQNILLPLFRESILLNK